MKVAFFSSVLNHHQLPLCQGLYDLLGNDFVFVSTMRIEEQRIKLGYTDYSDTMPYCYKMYESEESFQEAYKIAKESDVLIAGVIPYRFLFDRLEENKITFRYSESIFRHGFWRILSPRALAFCYKEHFRFRNRPFYLLCASAYLAWDVERIFSYRGKRFKWGYFPGLIEYDKNELFYAKNSNTTSILWVGRFVDFKQPERVIHLCNYLKKQGLDFSIEMIGNGPLEKRCKKLAAKYCIQDRMRFLGPMLPIEVLAKMKEANIFLFTSNKGEGWGVVLNEAMNAGCAVVANRAAGSTPFLVSDGLNGLVYDDKNLQHFYSIVSSLVQDKAKSFQLGINAYKTIFDHWNPGTAVRRLYDIMAAVMEGNEPRFYEAGPLSKAEIIKR